MRRASVVAITALLASGCSAILGAGRHQGGDADGGGDLGADSSAEAGIDAAGEAGVDAGVDGSADAGDDAGSDADLGTGCASCLPPSGFCVAGTCVPCGAPSTTEFTILSASPVRPRQVAVAVVETGGGSEVRVWVAFLATTGSMVREVEMTSFVALTSSGSVDPAAEAATNLRDRGSDYAISHTTDFDIMRTTGGDIAGIFSNHDDGATSVVTIIADSGDLADSHPVVSAPYYGRFVGVNGDHFVIHDEGGSILSVGLDGSIDANDPSAALPHGFYDIRSGSNGVVAMVDDALAGPVLLWNVGAGAPSVPYTAPSLPAVPMMIAHLDGDQYVLGTGISGTAEVDFHVFTCAAGSACSETGGIPPSPAIYSALPSHTAAVGFEGGFVTAALTSDQGLVSQWRTSAGASSGIDAFGPTTRTSTEMRVDFLMGRMGYTLAAVAAQPTGVSVALQTAICGSP